MDDLGKQIEDLNTQLSLLFSTGEMANFKKDLDEASQG